MRSFFFLLLLSGNATAQQYFFGGDSAFVSTVDLPAREPFDTSRSYKKVNVPYIYIISDKDLYDHFGYNTALGFHDIDFKEHHILGYMECRQCVLHCEHESGKRDCHRNACYKQWIWLKRENSKAFKVVPRLNVSWHSLEDELRYRDTIMKVASDSSTWFTAGHGDCFAKFSYELLSDKFYPVLILKETNRYGGCRSGRSQPARISFREPEGILYKIKRTVLLER